MYVFVLRHALFDSYSPTKKIIALTVRIRDTLMIRTNKFIGAAGVHERLANSELGLADVACGLGVTPRGESKPCSPSSSIVSIYQHSFE